MARLRRVFAAALGAVAVAGAAAATALGASGEISTVAGNGTAGFDGDDGPAAAASLNLPRSVASMPGGGFLITDRVNNRIRRVLPDGTITTVAGSGPTGSDNGAFAGDGGPATDARLDFIHDAEPTPDGGFLISDLRNQRIRYVSPQGIIYTVAGSGPFGCFCDGGFSGDGGDADAARLNNPHGLGVYPDGSYLIADTDNNRIRRVSVDGTIATVAGSGPTGSDNGGFAGDEGPATSARLRRPFEVAPTPDGGFLITDTGNQVIRRVDADGTITTVAGLPGEAGFAGDGGPATEALLDSPHAAVPLPDGGFLIADKNNHRVRRVAADGTIETVAGSGLTGDPNGAYGGDGGPATAALLNRPKAIAVLEGGFLIADEGNNRIRFVEGPAPAGVPLAVSIVGARMRVRRGGALKLRYTATDAADARLRIRRRGRRLASLRRRARAGANTITLRPRLTRRLRPGRYRLLLTARSDSGATAQDRARLRVLPRRG